MEGVGTLSAAQMELNYICKRMQTTSSFYLCPPIFPPWHAVRHISTSISSSFSLILSFFFWFASTGIDLENIVYYKDDTHYFVMTAKKQSLLEKGVILHVSDQRVWLF